MFDDNFLRAMMGPDYTPQDHARAISMLHTTGRNEDAAAQADAIADAVGLPKAKELLRLGLTPPTNELGPHAVFKHPLDWDGAGYVQTNIGTAIAYYRSHGVTAVVIRRTPDAYAVEVDASALMPQPKMDTLASDTHFFNHGGDDDACDRAVSFAQAFVECVGSEAPWVRKVVER